MMGEGIFGVIKPALHSSTAWTAVFPDSLKVCRAVSLAQLWKVAPVNGACKNGHIDS